MIPIILIYLYLFYGFYNIYTDKLLTTLYIAILGFMLFKIIADYRSCTLAYAECKLRKVKREDSYINMILDPLIDSRKSNHVYVIVALGIIILYYYFTKERKLKDFLKSIYGSEELKKK